MKILGVCASPRKRKTSHDALSAALESARDFVPGVETHLVELAGQKLNGCLACGKCLKEFRCSQDDYMSELLPLLTQEDLGGIIISSPVYLGCMTAQAKAFLDRCVPLRRNGFLLRNKVGGAVAVGGVRNGGQSLVLQQIHAAMLVQDMIVVSDGQPTSHFGGTGFSGMEGGMKSDEFGLATAAGVGRRVAEVAAKLMA
jgi:multimeric flavodoxin WrbA